MMNTKPKSEVSARSGNTLTKLLIAVLLFSSACSSTYQTRSSDDDDIYYSAKDAPLDDEINYSTPADPDNYTYQYDDSEIEGSESNTQAPASTSEEYYDEDGNTYITNNYYSDDNYAFDYDDYYDYAYASRLRRFHSSNYGGYGYYNSYYTNTYWYDYNPFNWGVSIYLGYPWWGAGYSTYGWYSGYYGGYGHGYYGHGYGGYYGYGYGGYGYGGYGCGGSGYGGYGYGGYGYGGYGYGGYGGYYEGYYNPYYYNSYDATSYYYGPRTLTSSNGSDAPQTLAQLYVKDKKNSGMNVLPEDKTKLSQQSGQAITPSKGVTNAGKPISGKGVQAAQDINTIKGQQSLSPVKNTDMKDKGVVFTGKPVNKPNPDKPAINKPVESKSESYSYPGYNKPVQEIKSKAHVSPGYSQPKQGVKSKSYSGSNDFYERETKPIPKTRDNTQVKSKTPYTYSKPKSNQRVDKPKSYGKSGYGNQSSPKSNSHTNYSKPKSSTPSKSNYSNRGSSSSSPKRSYSSPKSSGQRGSSVGRTSSPSRSSSPSRTSKPRR